jgi:hypothetical protein
MKDDLDNEIEAYEKMQNFLKEHYLGKFVIIFQGRLFGSYDTFENAAETAVSQIGNEVYLIRQVN